MKFRKLVHAAVVTLIAATGLVAVPAGPASAATVQTFRNRWSGFCLDHSTQSGLRAFPCNGLNYQKWNVHVHPDNTRRLRNENTQICLGSQLGVLTGSCRDNRTYSWNIERLSDGIRFFSEYTDTRCLWDTGRTHPHGGHYVEISGCIGGYYPSQTIWY
jgi:hypothetical protein